MVDFEVHLSISDGTRQIGRARSNRVRGKETVVFEYADGWLLDADRFELAPDLPLTRGGFAPPAGQAMHGSLGDSAPDTWGRRLMQRAERRQAEKEGRAVRTLMESDYLLGVSDETRLGALRFRRVGGEEFLLEASAGYFALSLVEARLILKEVALATSTWRAVAQQVGAAATEINRMASAFEHDALAQALALP